MIAHKIRNRMTVMIYSLSLSFIILCVVSYNLEIENSKLAMMVERGVYFELSASSSTEKRITPEKFEPILKKHEGNIASFSW